MFHAKPSAPEIRIEDVVPFLLGNLCGGRHAWRSKTGIVEGAVQPTVSGLDFPEKTVDLFGDPDIRFDEDGFPVTGFYFLYNFIAEIIPAGGNDDLRAFPGKCHCRGSSDPGRSARYQNHLIVVSFDFQIFSPFLFFLLKVSFGFLPVDQISIRTLNL
jgi:hypothetical protein